MPTAETQVTTDRASRYLVQLCRHLNQMSGMRHRAPTRHGSQAPAIEQVDWSDTTGTIRFAQGTCTLHAGDDALTLRVEAEDEDTLRQLQEGIARRLNTIGRRDNLTVHWPQLPTTDSPPPEEAPVHIGKTRRARRTGGPLTLGAIAVLAILVHVGILGATLATSAWASWGANIVLAVVAVKIIAVVLHGLLGRSAFRHRGTVGRWLRGHRRVTGEADTGHAHPHEHAA